MALEYYNHIDLNKNQLQNAVIHPLGDAPSSASEGQIYYDSTVGDKQVYVYNGSAWIALGGNKFDKIAVSGQDNIVADGTNDTLTFAEGSNVTITTDASTDTITIASTDTNTQLTTEEVQDIVGGMFSGNTETNITATYEDSDGTIDLVSTNTQLSNEQVQDIIGNMVDGNTETNISVTYDDSNGKLNFASTDTNTQRGAGTGLTLNGNNLDVSASQTSISELKNASLVIGRDADNDIDFATDNAIIFRANGADQLKFVDGKIEPITNNDIDLGTTSKKLKNIYAAKYYGSDHAHYLDPDGAASYIKGAIRLTTGSSRITNNTSTHPGASFEIKSGTGAFSPGANAAGGQGGILYMGLQGRTTRSGVTVPTHSYMLLKNTDAQYGGPYETSHASKVFWALGRNNAMGSSPSPAWASGQGTPRFMLHMTGDGHLKTGTWNGSSYIAGTGALTVNHNLVVKGSTTLGDSTADTVTVSGNLIVNGTTTTVNSNEVNIGDNIIVLNSDETGTPSANAGIEVERGTSTNVRLIFNENTDRWTFSNDGSTFYNIPTTGDITDTNTQNTYSVSIPGSSTKLRLTGAGHDGATTDDIEFVGSGGTTVTRTNDSKFTISSTDTNTQLTTEQVQDIVGGMVSGNTETNISVTYQDGDGTLDFAATDTNTQLATAAAEIDVSDSSFNTKASFNHGLASKNLIVQMYDVTTGEIVFADIDHVDNSNIDVIFATKPTNDIRVVVIDAKHSLTDKSVTYS